MQTLVTLPHLSANIPLSKQQYLTFPPEQYPLCLSIIFTKKAVEFRSFLKAVLDDIPKNEIKYRSTKNIATTFNCYCHSLESIRPIINDVLGKTEMYVRYGLIKDKQIFPDDLWKQGQQILSKWGWGKKNWNGLIESAHPDFNRGLCLSEINYTALNVQLSNKGYSLFNSFFFLSTYKTTSLITNLWMAKIIVSIVS